MDMQTDLYKCWKVRGETRVALTPLVPSVVQEELAVDCCAEFAPCCSSVPNNRSACDAAAYVYGLPWFSSFL